jgi:hypothetical protein
MFENVILQAIAHARMRQRITGVLAHFDYMRVADTINSRSRKTVTSLTNYYKCC